MAVKETSKDLLAGVFLLTGIGLFFLSLLVLGRERNLFGVFVPFSTFYADVRGLNVGAPVRLGGIAIGRVAAVDLAADPLDARVQVKFEVQDKYSYRIRADSLATIETQGLLGDKFINLSAAGSGAELSAGSIIQSREAADLGNIIRKVETLAETASAGIQSVSDLAKAVDPKKIAATVDSLHNISVSLNKSLGDNSIVADISSVLREVKTGSGLLHNMIYPSAEGAQLAQSVTQSLKDFAKVANNLEQITGGLSKGSGTLGALLVDSKVYDNLVEVTDDAKRSFVLRSVVRSALNEKKE